MSLFIINQWIGVGAGGAILVIDGIIYICLKYRFKRSRKKSKRLPSRVMRVLNVVFFILNCLATGIVISSVYTHFNRFPEIWKIASIGAGAVVAFCVFCVLTFIPFFRRHYIISGISYIVLLTIALILATVFSDRYAFSFALFMLLPLIGFVIIISTRSENANALMSNAMVSSFSVLILSAIIAVIILSEGEGADVFDAFTGADGKATKNKIKDYNPYVFNIKE